MPLPIVGGVFAWLLGLFTSTMGTLFTWLLAKTVYEKALFITITTAAVVVMASLTAALALGIKGAIMVARVTMPPILAQATYFLPSNINMVLALVITVRSAVFLYRWTVQTMNYYLPRNNAGYGGLL